MITVESHRNGQTRRLTVTTKRAPQLLKALSAEETAEQSGFGATREPLTWGFVIANSAVLSGWGDLNSRPSVPQTDALTKLRHSP